MYAQPDGPDQARQQHSYAHLPNKIRYRRACMLTCMGLLHFVHSDHPHIRAQKLELQTSNAQCLTASSAEASSQHPMQLGILIPFGQQVDNVRLPSPERCSSPAKALCPGIEALAAVLPLEV